MANCNVLVVGMEYTTYGGQYYYPQQEGRFSIFSKDGY